jgi:hypothetical protein
MVGGRKDKKWTSDIGQMKHLKHCCLFNHLLGIKEVYTASYLKKLDVQKVLMVSSVIL